MAKKPFGLHGLYRNNASASHDYSRHFSLFFNFQTRQFVREMDISNAGLTYVFHMF